MKKAGRPPNPFKHAIEPISGYVEDEKHDRPAEHEIEDAMHTLTKAETIKANPKLMAHVHEASGKKIRSLKSLKALAGKKSLID